MASKPAPSPVADFENSLDALEKLVDKMEASSGIRTRFYAPEDWATSDVALPAAKQAIERMREMKASRMKIPPSGTSFLG